MFDFDASKLNRDQLATPTDRLLLCRGRLAPRVYAGTITQTVLTRRRPVRHLGFAALAFACFVLSLAVALTIGSQPIHVERANTLLRASSM